MPSNEPAPPATPVAAIDTEETMELSARSNKPSLLAAAVLGLLALGASAQARAQDGVPDGTLAYTLVVTGHADTTADDGSSIDSRIHWQVEGRFHLKGYAIASQAGLDARNDSAVLSAASGLEQAVSACGDDQACMASAAMHYAQTHQSAAAAVRNAGARHHVLGRNPAWQFLGGECDATGVVDDSETDTGTDVGEGYSKSESDYGTRVGKHSLECGSVGSRLKMTGDSSSRTYALAIPWLGHPGDRQRRRDRIQSGHGAWPGFEAHRTAIAAAPRRAARQQGGPSHDDRVARRWNTDAHPDTRNADVDVHARETVNPQVRGLPAS
jgi:hypothetical protein